MNRGLVAFGILFLIVGILTGYLMCTHPEGLNPSWPLGMALIAPAVFAFGGLHLIATGLDKPRLSSVMMLAIVFCFWAIANWAAFFTPHVQCRATLSFLGAEILGWRPSEMACRNSLRAIVSGIDTLIFVGAGVSAWRRYRASPPAARPGG